MIDFWGTKDFQTLYNEFVEDTSGGKVFMMKEYISENTVLGKGVTVLLKKASPVILNILKELYLKDSCYIIGDIGMLFNMADKQKKKLQQLSELKKAKALARAAKNRTQLHTIIRRQKSIKKLINKIVTPQEREL